MSETTLLPVASRYTRSVHLYRDFAAVEESLQGYHITPLVIETLSRVMRSLDEASTLRAFSLIGPFGAGKSAFGLFLAHYLSLSPNERQVLVATHIVDPSLSTALPIEAASLLPVLVAGNHSSLRREIIRALYNTTQHNTTQHNTAALSSLNH